MSWPMLEQSNTDVLSLMELGSDGRSLLTLSFTSGGLLALSCVNDLTKNLVFDCLGNRRKKNQRLL
eukprot:5663655-Amphidinium_carterae.1